MKDAQMNKGALIASTYARGNNGKEKRNWKGEKRTTESETERRTQLGVTR